MKILTRKQIEQLLSIPAALEAIERGFILHSQKKTVIPPVASLHFEDPPGDCHIKYGYSKGGNYYVVKIASGFPDNHKLGLPTGNGLMLLFDIRTGEPLCLLQDEGYLTDIRTAAAGCIAAKYLAPKTISCIGIVGTGAQAYYQLRLLPFATSCRNVLIWGRDASKAMQLKERFPKSEWKIEVTNDLTQLTQMCNLIVTTTSSTSPLLLAHQIRPGTHVTAIGADDLGKQELDPALFGKADRIVVDSCSQCMQLGDVSYALKEGLIAPNRILELGQVIRDPSLGRTSEDQITIADLTGIAVQDLQIASVVFERNAQRSNYK